VADLGITEDALRKFYLPRLKPGDAVPMDFVGWRGHASYATSMAWAAISGDSGCDYRIVPITPADEDGVRRISDSESPIRVVVTTETKTAGAAVASKEH
jgi:hypothetical protein